MGDDAEWITWPAAAELVGAPVPTIDRYTRQGRIWTRPQGRPADHPAKVGRETTE